MELHLGLLPVSEAEIWDISKYLGLTETAAPASSETLSLLSCLFDSSWKPPSPSTTRRATPVQLEKLGAKQARQQQATVTLGKNMDVVTQGHMRA